MNVLGVPRVEIAREDICRDRCEYASCASPRLEERNISRMRVSLRCCFRGDGALSDGCFVADLLLPRLELNVDDIRLC